MPYRTDDDDWEQDDSWDESEDDGLDASAGQGHEAEDEDATTVLCPYCQREVYEDAPQCPYCEQYLSEEDTLPRRKPWWVVAGSLLCLYLIYRWIVG